VRVPYAEAMLTPLPSGVTPLQAVTAADNASLGRALVRKHVDDGRRRVLVLGWGAAGLYAVAFARLLGMARIVYVDESEDNVRLAGTLGAESVLGPPNRGLGEFDLVVDAAFRPDWLRQSIRLLEPEGAIECLAHFTDFTLPGHATYATGLTFHCAVCSNGPHVAPTLDAIASGALPASAVWSREVDWEDLPAAMAEPGRKLVGIRT
jgi:threonine dehydrogenase-like Zn-dependent dehydrogenase